MSILIKDFLFSLKRSPGPKKYELVAQDEHPTKVKNIVNTKISFATAFFKIRSGSYKITIRSNPKRRSYLACNNNYKLKNSYMEPRKLDL